MPSIASDTGKTSESKTLSVFRSLPVCKRQQQQQRITTHRFTQWQDRPNNGDSYTDTSTIGSHNLREDTEN